MKYFGNGTFSTDRERRQNRQISKTQRKFPLIHEMVILLGGTSRIRNPAHNKGGGLRGKSEYSSEG